MGESPCMKGSDMPRQERFSTKYPGVYYVMGTHISTGRPERIYYIRYRKGGHMVEEKAGRQFQDDMTAAKANQIRTPRIEGRELSNQGRRDKEKARRLAELNRWTISRLWDEYKRLRTMNKGLSVDDSRFNLYLSPVFGQKTPDEIVTMDVDRIRVDLLKKKGKAPQTVKSTLALLKRIISFGIKKGLIDAPSPRRLNIELPRVDNKRTDFLTPDEIRSLLGAIAEDPNRNAAHLMQLALFTGMRRGELFNLRWEDLDLENGFIHIQAPKGGTSQKIPMNEAARELLEALPRSSSIYVFPGKDGGRLKNIQPTLQRIRTRAGLPKDFRPLHGLRHTFASMLASSGKVDMYTLQKLLTHKSPVMTQRYAHLRDDALKRASGVAGEIFDDLRKEGQPHAAEEAR